MKIRHGGANTITDSGAAQAMDEFRKVALKPEAIAHAIGQPADVDTTDIVVWPVASPA